MWLKELYKKLKYGVRYSSETYISYLRKIGINIGCRTTIFDSRTTIIDETRPWMISIGDDVQITSGVTILSHGFDWSVLKGTYGEVLGSSGGVEIGNNVFIGMHTTILKGVHIGNNVIVGANSLVNKNIPDNCVVAGNPCRVVMSLDKYYEKRKSSQMKEATELVRLYRKRIGKEPDEVALHEFFWLFSDEPDTLPDVWQKMNQITGNEEFTIEVMRKHKKQYKNLDDFLNSIE